ncbi:hypothetical protein [Streptomyces sp. NPDC008150]|uniref:hypothetical protein n=1 Tax=Streptomyces sp. NPDC008150 TaxID=3364816 RepID=UPI0036E53BB5
MIARFSDTLARHFWLQMALSWLLTTALLLLIYPGRSLPGVLARVVATSVGGIVIVLRQRSREKRAANSSTDGLVALNKQLREGELPAEPERREAMRELVDLRLRRSRHRWWAVAFLFLLFAGITALTATTGGLRQTIGFAAVTVVFVGWLIIGGNLWQRRLHHMRDLLDGAAESGGPAVRPLTTPGSSDRRE